MIHSRTVRDHSVPGWHNRCRTEKNAYELSNKLLARVGSEKITAFQISQKIGGAGSNVCCYATGHQIGGDIGGCQKRIGQLRDFAHRSNRCYVRFARRAASNQSKEKAQHNGQYAKRWGNGKSKVLK